jgi:arylsulfatase
VIASYEGKYAAGWDEIRVQRHRRMVALGLVKRDWKLAPRDPRVPSWDEVPYKDWQQRRMEVYAAQIDVMDQGIGRIIEAVRLSGELENTLVMFLADNGGCAEEIGPNWKGLFYRDKSRDGRHVQLGNDPKIMPGPETTYQSYGIPWANVSNTPFLLYKHWVHEGGIATPLIVHWPAVITDGGKITHELGHVIDVMATCLDVAGAEYPKEFGRHDIQPLEGKSLKPIFEGQSRRRGPLYWEHEGNRAVRYGKWKLVAVFNGPWELYDMSADRTELNNLAEQRPDIVEKMSEMYDTWAERSNVEPWGQRR